MTATEQNALHTHASRPSPTSCVPFIRPVRSGDLDAVLALAERGGSGLTSLPPERDTLADKIAASEAAICSSEARERGSAIMLVAEVGEIVVATGMIFARVGAEWPFYSYRLTRQAAVSRALGRHRAQKVLNLVNDFDGEVEVGGLLVDPAMRGRSIGRLMARARYLFIGRHRDWFANRVMAELRGWQDEAGHSPVWEAIGRHFYDMDFHEADRTGAIQGNQFIADLGPRYPLYVSMLSAAAQQALGQPHDDGRPARDMLLEEGFRDEGYVDIFDGGPTLVADIDALRTLRRAISGRIAGLSDDLARGEQMLLSSGHGASFSAAVSRVEVEAATVPGEPCAVVIERGVAEAIGASEGEILCLTAQ